MDIDLDYLVSDNRAEMLANRRRDREDIPTR